MGHNLFACLLVFAGFAGGCTAPLSTPPSNPKMNPRLETPALTVRIECGDCQVRSSVAGLIEAAYNEAAHLAGVRVTQTDTASLIIKEYTERSSALRAVSFFAGPLAFALKDEIKAVVNSSGRQLDVQYHYRIPFMGIESVATKIGQISFEKLGQ